jgi:hypothetical protein
MLGTMGKLNTLSFGQQKKELSLHLHLHRNTKFYCWMNQRMGWNPSKISASCFFCFDLFPAGFGPSLMVVGQ